MKRLLVSLTCLALLAGCAGPRLARLPELPQPPKRLEMYGYSFMPLDEKGWKVGGRDGTRLTLGKQGPSKDETVVILSGNAYHQPFASHEAFEQFIRKLIDKSAGPSERFDVQQSDLTMLKHQGADCARTHLVSVDHQAQRRSGGKGDMVLEIEQLYCIHPGDDGVVTYLGYSQRYTPGKRDPAFDSKAQKLFDSFKLTDF